MRDARRSAATAEEAASEAATRARAAEAEEERLAAARAQAGRRAVAAGTALQEAAARLDRAEAARAAAEAAVEARAAALIPMLPALRRLSAWPAETLLALPVPPEEALRGALVLRGVARHLEAEAVAWRHAAVEAAAAAARATEERSAVAAARAEAMAAEEAVEAGLAEARRRRAGAVDAETIATRRAAATAARARDLQGAVERLEREAQERERRRLAEERAAQERAERARAARQQAERDAAREAARERAEAAAARQADPGPAPRGARATPVAGRVTREWGEGGAQGQTWTTPPHARVVSPCSGRIAFASPFRSYGLLLIVDCGGGYHVVLAGLERLDASAGQRVAAGEAVGVMGDGDSGRPSLYVELRRSGQAVDPRPWLRQG
ncbi:peptidoglycan DD-metalloendopeptidase family protein [Roseomonas sp. OT10]|uniref:murein hydrolase activator EnvC family protein n=1 Tax=Roseomonas cutis TaxID=2897332 RepID=UPI001E3FD861|nr:peptidoglycan DD-metalloendopeptidase family protein [Roseomonas sp. OT10]UFN51206.1 peptidoglycan DD-metalloendopeptidase family protein [Roseomonas sp. OT10]